MIIDTKILKNIFGDVYVCRCASLVTVKKFKIWDKLIRNYRKLSDVFKSYCFYYRFGDVWECICCCFGDWKQMRHYSFGDVLKNSFKIWEKMVTSIKRSLVTVPERNFSK